MSEETKPRKRREDPFEKSGEGCAAGVAAGTLTMKLSAEAAPCGEMAGDLRRVVFGSGFRQDWRRPTRP